MRDDLTAVDIYNGSVSTATYSLNSDRWYHFALVMTASSTEVFVNGASIGTIGTYSSITGLPLYIGSGSGTDVFPGMIDEFRVWDIALSATQIQQNMYRELKGDETNLIAYYRFNHQEGTTVTDHSGNSHTGTLNNMLDSNWIQESPVNRFASSYDYAGHAVQFDGTDDYIEIPNHSDFEKSTLTFELWARLDWTPGSAGYNPSPLAIRSTSSVRFSFHVLNDMTGLDIYNGSASTATYSFSSGTWYHFAFVMTSSSTEVFINGASIGTIGAYNSNTGLPLMIGASSSNSEYFQGIIDEVRVWDIALTALQIQNNMYWEFTGNESNLVAYYRFNDQAGNTLIDDSGNSHTGTLFNMQDSSWVSSSIVNRTASSFSFSLTHFGDSVTVKGQTTDYTGVQLYVVGERPNNSSAPNDWDYLLNKRYWGVFPVGSSSVYDVEYNYSNNATIVDDTLLKLATRSSADPGTWEKASANLNKTSDLLTASFTSNKEMTLVSGNEDIIIETIDSQNTTTDTAISIPIVLTDIESDPCMLNISGTSSDTSLISDVSIEYTCNASGSYTITTRPLDSNSGNANITITVSDTYGMTSVTSFPITVVRARHSLDLDGIDDYANADVPITAINNITLETWINWDGYKSANSMIIVYNGNTGTSGYGMVLNQTIGYKISVLFGSVASFDHSQPLLENTWQHLAFTRDSTNWKFYINGELQSITGSETPNTPSGKLLIGSNNDEGECFSGQIDEIRLWDVELDQTTIKAWMIKQVTSAHPMCSYLKAYYQFNSSSGNYAYDTIASNHATLYHGATWSSNIPFSAWLDTGTTDWNTASNWEANLVPDEITPGFIVIENGTIYPILSAPSICNAIALGSNSYYTASYSTPLTINMGIYNIYGEQRVSLSNDGCLIKYNSDSATGYGF